MGAQIRYKLNSQAPWQGIGLKSLLILLILTSASFKTTGEPQQGVRIGGVSELNGNASIVRDQNYPAELDFSIQQEDQAETANGRMAITFLDDSRVSLTENSKLKITKYIFDPNPDKSELGIRFTLGTARFVTGKFNKISKQNIQLETPTANIAIRGTSFTTTVDELGRSLIILLPDEFGLSSGEIEVTTAAGTVLLSKPFEATTVDVFESSPSKPVILDLDLNIIDNLLIVNPPKEKEMIDEIENVSQETDILDFNELDIDYLAEDFLDNEADLEFTELDINYLDVNFLEDLLDIIQDVNELDQTETILKADLDLKGTAMGFDSNTQINTFATDNIITFLRTLEDTIRLDLDKTGSYTVILVQNGKSTQIIVNGGSSSTITIKQGD